MQISFAKWHCYGNDFLVFDGSLFQEGQLSTFTVFVCRPHSGLGADGCVFFQERSEGNFGFRIFNRDGGEAGMSGNGARCAAAQIHRSGQSAGTSLILHTRSGKKTLQLVAQESSTRWTYLSDLGRVAFLPLDIPCLVDDKEIVSQHAVEIEGRTLDVNALSVGNPQCAVILDRLPAPETFRRLGSKLENHPLFPDRTNVTFVQVVDRKHILIQVWERGVGPTASSGTGSCGAGVTVIRLGLVDSPVEVKTASGAQVVEWSQGSTVLLTGDAELVGEGYCYWEP